MIFVENTNQNIIPIPVGVQALLRQWMKERDALNAQISGVLQSVVVGKPGAWDLDESFAFMALQQPDQAAAAGE